MVVISADSVLFSDNSPAGTPWIQANDKPNT
jgi:hypothetical protein